MKFFDLIYTSLYSLKTHKLRSILTTLGIIIGVATVITMVAIIEGVNSFVYRAFGSVGSDVIYVQKWKWALIIGKRERGWWREMAKRKDLTLQDADAIKKLKTIAEVAPTYPVFGASEIKYRDKTLSVNDITGVTGTYFLVSGRTVERGRNFVDADNDFKRKVCIIGPFVAENLFDKEVPIGKEIIIGKHRFTVIGITDKKGELLGNNLDNVVYIPLKTALLYFKPQRTGWRGVFQSLHIAAKVEKGFTVEEAKEDIRKLLRKRRNLFFNQKDDFALNTQEMLLSMYRNLTMGIFFAMVGIASLALIVGGIGIMNIMLVSVSERTKEIGIRMAVGARKRDILMQFLSEAVFLTGVGGVLGLFLGAGLAKVVDVLTPLPSHIPLWSILIAVGFSMVVGLFFGIYPATKASKLDPIEALRYE